MKVLQEKTKIFLIAILTICGLFFNSTLVMADGRVLHEKHYSVNANETLLVKMSSADIIVSGWDKDEVSIKVEGSEKINDYFDFNFSYEDGLVKIKSEKKSDWSSWGFSKGFKLKVMVPEQFKLDLKTSGGDIIINMIEGLKELVTSGGDIKIEDSKGDLGALTSGGDVSVNKNIGKSVLKTSGGDIIAKNLKGNIEAITSGGDIDLLVIEGNISGKTSGGDILLNYKGENKGVELNTSGGDISISVPSNFKADVQLKTSGGSIKNNFSTSKISEVSKSKYEGKYNNGGESLTAKTSGGSITVDEK
ncbi:MAG: DUF4097 domain-containing protein [Bacteroidetes bacterium]|nr:DUF4097 domain-containing protein [Bacteroidota bacterium]MBU1114151.1 DUF4097 domain-containing protein [Bacteroidota bacterium]MBU1796828.1 DUF4097 domain-containing protein [Bacteroidota bacterium]